MSIKRSVTITCDGPCGTAVTQSNVPLDWQYLTLNSPNENAEDAIKYVAHLCPECAERVRSFLQRQHFALNSKKRKEEAHVL